MLCSSSQFCMLISQFLPIILNDQMSSSSTNLYKNYTAILHCAAQSFGVCIGLENKINSFSGYF